MKRKPPGLKLEITGHKRNNKSINEIMGYTDGPALILPQVYLGGVAQSNSAVLKKFQIKTVVNVAEEVDIEPLTPANSPIVAVHKFDWSHNQDLSQNIENAIDIIQCAKAKGLPVLVHCHQGISRSAALVIGFLMKTQRMTFENAYAFVKAKSPIISPNMLLVSQLLEFQTKWAIE